MKRFISLALVFVLLASSFAFAAEAEPVKAEGEKTFQEVYLDGGKVDLGAYLINQRNYVKLRDVAALLTATDAKFNVGFEDKKVVIKTGETYEKLDTDLVELPEGKVEALMGEQAFIFNGEEKMVKTALINQNNYLQLRELGELIGFGVHYNEETKAIELSSKVEEKAEEAKENAEEKKEEKAEEKVEPFVNETGVELKEDAIAALEKALKDKAAEKELGEVKNITVTKAKESKDGDKVVYEYEGTITTAEKKEKFEAKLEDGKFEIELSELAEKIEEIKDKVEEKAEEVKDKVKDVLKDAKEKAGEVKDKLEEKIKK